MDLPWWFHHSFGQREVTRPSGVVERFEQYKLNRIFANYDEFAEETQWHQFYSLKYEIESMRSRPALQGYCLTGMTDVHWEVNGLLDMWRNEKIFAPDLQRLQEPDCVIAEFPTCNYRGGDAVDVPVLFSHFSSRDLAGARLLWGTDTGQGGVVPIVESPAPGTVTTLGNIRFSIPALETPTAIVLTVVIRAKNGSRICENTYTLYAFPRPTTESGTAISFHDPLGTASGLDFSLQAAGHSLRSIIDSGPGERTLVLATAIDDVVLGHLNAGGCAVILADSEDAIPRISRFSCIKRAGTWLDGRWFSNYNWINPNHSAYRELSFHRLLAFESRYVVPAYAIAGVEPEEYDHVLSGMTLGWLNLNHALTLQVAVGSGKALITTFRFAAYDSDPYAHHLLNAYLRYARSEEFQPRLQWATNAAAAF
jgi:hypothetical protein